MSAADTILYVFLLLAFGVMGSIFTFVFLIHQKVNETASAPALLAPEERAAWEAEEEDQEPAAVPLDPSNPPIPRVFNPSADRDPRDYPLCNCHDKRLTAGEQIIWWPQPDGSVMIFHPDFIAEAAKAT